MENEHLFVNVACYLNAAVLQRLRVFIRQKWEIILKKKTQHRTVLEA